MKLTTLLLSAFTVLVAVNANADETQALEAAATGAHRSSDNIARNASRHPVETLKFFGIKSDMRVAEIWPGGGGWYTEVLAPYLKDNGKLFALNYDGSTGREYYERNAKKFKEKMAANPDVYSRVTVLNLMPPKSLPEFPDGEDDEVDMVLTFRNLHNWVRNGMAEQMFEQIAAILKPGGVLGLVAHRGTSEMTGVEDAKKGYLAESVAIRHAEKAGLEFIDSSQINSNPKDTKDHPEGVWSLPPVLRMGDTDREKFLAIGESDRMTLKFVKYE